MVEMRQTDEKTVGLIRQAASVVLALAVSLNASVALASDEGGMSPEMLTLKADLQSAFEDKDFERLHSHIDWEGVTEEKHQELIDVFSKVMDADHGRSTVGAIKLVDDDFLASVKANGILIDDEGRLVTPQVDPPTRTNLVPDYHVTFLIEKMNEYSTLGYSLYAGLHDNGQMMLIVDVPFEQGDRE